MAIETPLILGNGIDLTTEQAKEIASQNMFAAREISRDIRDVVAENEQPLPPMQSEYQSKYARALAFDEKETPDPNADPIEWALYGRKVQAKKDAQLRLSYLAYQAQNPVQRADLALAVSKMGQQFEYTPESMQAMMLDHAAGQYDKMLDEFGALPREIMYDPKFMAMANDDTYAYAKTLYDMGMRRRHSGFFDRLGFAMDQAEELHDLDLQKYRGEITLEEAALEEYRIRNDLSAVAGEEDPTASMQLAMMVDDLGSAVAENPEVFFGTLAAGALQGAITTAAVGAVAGTVAPGAGNLVGAGGGAVTGAVAGALRALPYAITAASTVDTYQRKVGVMAYQAMELDPTLTFEQAKQKVKGYAVMIAGADLLSDVIFGKVLGGSSERLVKRLAGYTAAKKGTQEAGEALTNKLQQRVKNNLTAAAKDFIGLQISELSTEGVQGVLEERGAAYAAGQDVTADQSWRTFQENVKSAMGATMLLGAIGVSPRAAMMTADLTRAIGSLNNFKQGIEAASVAKEIKDQNIPNVAEILSKIYPGNFTVRAQDLKENLAEKKKSVTDLPEQFTTLEKDLLSDPEYTYTLNINDLAGLLDNEKGKLVLDSVKADVNDLTPKEVARVVEGLGDLKTLHDTLEHDLNSLHTAATKKAQIRQQVMDALVNQGILTAERADPVSSVFANMVGSLAQDAELDIGDVYNSFNLNIERYQPTLDVGGVEHDSMHPNADLGYSVVGKVFKQGGKLNALFNRDAKFSTVLHELAHVYLTMLSDLDARVNQGGAINNARLRERMDDISIALDLKDNFNLLSTQEQVVAQERFVALFLQNFLTSGKREHAPLVGKFRTWIMQSLRDLHPEAYSNLREMQAQRKQAAEQWKELNPGAELPPEYRELTNEELYVSLLNGETAAQTGSMPPPLSQEFADMLNGITMVDNMGVDLSDLYRGTDGVISAMLGMDVELDKGTVKARTARDNEQAKPTLTEEDRQVLEQMRKAWLQELFDLRESLDDLAVLYALGIFDTSKKLSEIQSALKSLAKEGNSEWIDFVHGVEKRLTKLKSDKKNTIKEDQKRPEIHALQPLVLNRTEMRSLLDQETFDRLDKSGRLAADGLTLAQLRQEYIKRNTTREQARALIETASLRNNADLDRLSEKRAIEALQREVLRDRAFTDEQLQAVAEFKRKMGVKAFNILNKMLGRRSITEKQLTSLAKFSLSQMNVGDLDFRSWGRQVKDYEIKARRYMLEGDLQNAALYLQKSAALSARITEGVKLKQDMEKQLRSLRDVYNSNSDSTRKNYDQNTLGMGRMLLSRLGLYDAVQANSQMMLTKQYAPAVYAVYHNLINDPRFAHSYQNTKIVDMLSAIDLLGAIKQKANLTSKLLRAERAVTMEQSAAALRAATEQHNRKHLDTAAAIASHRTVTIDGQTLQSTISEQSNLRKVYNAWRASIDKVLPLCQELDKATHGAFTEYIYRPIRMAFDIYKLIVRDLIKRTNKNLKQFKTALPKEWRGVINADEELGLSFGTKGKFRRNGKTELLGFMMHIGNEYNFRALGEWIANNKHIDFNLPKAERIRQGQALITRFINRMISVGVMNKNFFDTLQKLWDINEEAKKYAQKGHYQKTGHYFKEQENRTIRTPWGEYKGGYAPLKKDRDFDYSSQYGKSMEDIEPEILNSLPRVNSSFTVERTGNTGYPIDINIEHIMRQVDDVVRYGVVQPVVDQVNTLLTNRAYGVGEAFTATNRPEIYRQVFRPWLERVCAGRAVVPHMFQNMPWINQALTALRTRSSAMVMFLNLNNTIQGLTNIIPAMTRVNPKYLAYALDSIFSPRVSNEAIRAKSDFMERRLDRQSMDFNEALRAVFMPAENLHGFAKARGYHKAIQHWAVENSYVLQKMVQNMLDRIVWTGKYCEVMDSLERQGGMDLSAMDLEAVRQADEAIIATQGSFDIIDASNAEMSAPLFQLFVQFGNYFFTMSDLMFSTLQIANNPDDPRPLVWARRASAVALTMLAPAIIGDAINKTFSRGWDDDDEEALVSPVIDCLAFAPLKMFLGAVPVAGQAATSLYNEAFLNKNYYTDSYFNLPVVTMTTAGYEGVQRLTRSAFGDEDVNLYRAYRDAGQFAALVLGIPMIAFPTKWAAYMSEWAGGEIRPTSGTDAFFGAITGKPSADAMK